MEVHNKLDNFLINIPSFHFSPVETICKRPKVHCTNTINRKKQCASIYSGLLN